MGKWGKINVEIWKCENVKMEEWRKWGKINVEIWKWRED